MFIPNQAAGSEVWLTVTSPEEARQAAALGVDALVVQGVEAGGHRGVFVDDDDASELTLLAALQLIGAAIDLPLVGAGAIMHGAALAAVLTAGAVAGQLGSAYLLSTEAATAEAYRKGVAGAVPTGTKKIVGIGVGVPTFAGFSGSLHGPFAVLAFAM